MMQVLHLLPLHHKKTIAEPQRHSACHSLDLHFDLSLSTKRVTKYHINLTRTLPGSDSAQCYPRSNCKFKI